MITNGTVTSDQAALRQFINALFEPCPKCPQLRDAIDVLNNCSAEGCWVEAQPLDHEGERDGPRCTVSSDLKLKCPCCKGTGYVPTKEGRTLLNFVGVFSGEVFGLQPLPDSEDEIAF